MPARKKTSSPKEAIGNRGFEAKLWLAADKLRNNIDAAKYKHVVLGLIFLKYISDTLEEKMPRLVAELAGQFAESAKLEAAIRENLKGLGYAL